MRALEIALRVSGGVAHAMAVRVGVGADGRAVLSTNAASCAPDLVLDRGLFRPDDLVPFVREILVTKSHSFSTR